LAFLEGKFHLGSQLQCLPRLWPLTKLVQKNTNLFLVAFHAMMATFIAAGIIPAFEMLSEDLKVSITRTSYLVAVQIAFQGVAPLFWRPISNRIGRRPIWLISTALSAVANIGCAESKSYAAQVVMRSLVSIFICPALAIGSATVAETFFTRERGQKVVCIFPTK
jgi:MFS family permease